MPGDGLARGLVRHTVPRGAVPGEPARASGLAERCPLQGQPPCRSQLPCSPKADPVPGTLWPGQAGRSFIGPTDRSERMRSPRSESAPPGSIENEGPRSSRWSRPASTAAVGKRGGMLHQAIGGRRARESSGGSRGSGEKKVEAGGPAQLVAGAPINPVFGNPERVRRSASAHQSAEGPGPLLRQEHPEQHVRSCCRALLAGVGRGQAAGGSQALGSLVGGRASRGPGAGPHRCSASERRPPPAGWDSCPAGAHHDPKPIR